MCNIGHIQKTAVLRRPQRKKKVIGFKWAYQYHYVFIPLNHTHNRFWYRNESEACLDDLFPEGKSGFYCFDTLDEAIWQKPASSLYYVTHSITAPLVLLRVELRDCVVHAKGYRGRHQTVLEVIDRYWAYKRDYARSS
jgi:hypothetical protein